MTDTAPQEPAPSPIRPPRPNYRQIHAKPLPLDVFPLPSLVPHNPLSVLHIIYVYVSQLIKCPSSHPRSPVQGWYHPESNSVHINGETQIRHLWERGFFGKGSLSRSEPTWLHREKKSLGLEGLTTSEDYTQERRDKRRRMKLDRALKEREAIEETIQQEQTRGDIQGDAVDIEGKAFEPLGGIVARAEALDPNARAHPAPPEAVALDQQEVDAPAISEADMPQQQEHLQLCAEEAFFLTFALGALTINDTSLRIAISSSDMLLNFRSHSYFPSMPRSDLTPFDPFLLSYVTYHHYRSLGWVVRPGIKFAVDWLLYLRGPAFSHAEFAVVILPSFRDEYWWEEERRVETERRSRKDWWWFHCLQRVQAQVKKGLVICWVDIPRPDQVMALGVSAAEAGVAHAKGMDDCDNDIGGALKRYKVRDMSLRRWLPNRSRD